jgi:hypothetical protein
MNNAENVGIGAAGGAIVGGVFGGPVGAALGATAGAGLGSLLGGSDTSVNYADEEAAKMLQEQFQDWQSTFKPIELQALNQVSLNNASVLPAALDEARKNVSGAYGTMPGILERQNRGLGINETPQQSASIKRMMNVNKAAATAGAENKTRANVRTMDDQLLLGASPQLQ